MEIREYRAYNEEEILSMYASVGWAAYTDQPEVLKKGFENSLLTLAAYEGSQLLGISRPCEPVLVTAQIAFGYFVPGMKLLLNHFPGPAEFLVQFFSAYHFNQIHHAQQLGGPAQIPSRVHGVKSSGVLFRQFMNCLKSILSVPDIPLLSQSYVAEI